MCENNKKLKNEIKNIASKIFKIFKKISKILIEYFDEDDDFSEDYHFLQE